jgi:hypothetical protein
VTLCLRVCRSVPLLCGLLVNRLRRRVPGMSSGFLVALDATTSRVSTMAAGALQLAAAASVAVTDGKVLEHRDDHRRVVLPPTLEERIRDLAADLTEWFAVPKVLGRLVGMYMCTPPPLPFSPHDRMRRLGGSLIVIRMSSRLVRVFHVSCRVVCQILRRASVWWVLFCRQTR